MQLSDLRNKLQIGDKIHIDGEDRTVLGLDIRRDVSTWNVMLSADKPNSCQLYNGQYSNGYMWDYGMTDCYLITPRPEQLPVSYTREEYARVARVGDRVEVNYSGMIRDGIVILKDETCFTIKNEITGYWGFDYRWNITVKVISRAPEVKEEKGCPDKCQGCICYALGHRAPCSHCTENHQLADGHAEPPDFYGESLMEHFTKSTITKPSTGIKKYMSDLSTKFKMLTLSPEQKLLVENEYKDVDGNYTAAFHNEVREREAIKAEAERKAMLASYEAEIIKELQAVEAEEKKIS